MIDKSKKYCNSLTEYSRYKTREVFIGKVPLGGNNPIRIQSMTTTDTMDTVATVEQTIKMVDAGCEYVRITAPSINEAKNLENIKNELRKRECNVPLIADIHFTPNAAEIAAQIVEKVRVNPGNYADKKKINQQEYTSEEYNAELRRIREKFTPLVNICKEYGTAMRIGTNHGSLSDRIMNRYGDTPLGMVESALEFVRICEGLNYYNIILSMKASNTQVMVQAYRLLVNRMINEGMNYPLHLGVTEAGGGEDGRIKSALGIGTLLEDGLGDTIRVSLTEDPEYEAPVAISLVNRYTNRKGHKTITPVDENPIDPFTYSIRKSFELPDIGGSNHPIVTADLSSNKDISYDDLKDIGYTYDAVKDNWNVSDIAADFIFTGNNNLSFPIPSGLMQICNYQHWLSLCEDKNSYPLLNSTDYLTVNKLSEVLNFLKIHFDELTEELIEKLKNENNTVLIIETKSHHGMAEQRRLVFALMSKKIENSVIIKRDYKNISLDEMRLFSSTDLGALLIDGMGDGVWITVNQILTDKKENEKTTFVNESKPKFINRTLFGILQAARVRISKTDYIACPSCGRTLFALQETTEMIRKRTSHLKGLKIAIMGCIVNGPGEMADADYGYVGSGIDKISLYRGKEVVRKNIPSSKAVNLLIKLIKDDGNWVDPA
ncbi:MAG: 4-hydroxy-3-methylbut-2-en-1-yl diphosphate synthase [Ignavibacteriae bacterium]|nr:MAG: 4-hydroxy-3-methylbut-2-en-1-yl diphosphate synthase [Ignavibacteriota bacterium]